MKDKNIDETNYPTDNWIEIINTLEETLLIVNNNFEILDINLRGTELLQKEKSEIIGKKCFTLFKTKGTPEEDCAVLKSSKSKKSEKVEIFDERLKKWLQIKTSPVFNKKGEILKFVEVINDITKARNNERKLKESEERFRLLHENAGLGIGYYSPDGTIISFNEIAAKNMGGQPSDFSNKNIYDIFPKDAADVYFKRINDAIASDTPNTYEDLVSLSTGDYWFLSTYTRINDSKNNILGVQIISSEISKQKDIEKALKESESQLKQAQKIGSIGSWKKIIKTGKRTWDKELYQNYGLTHELEIPEYSVWLNRVFKEDQKLLINAHKIAIEEKKDYRIVYRFKRFDNDKTEYILTTGKAHFDKNGKPDYLFGIDQNITAQKTAENLLKESEEKFRNLVENINDLVYRFEIYPENKFSFVSSSAAEITGYTPEEHYADPELGYKMIHPEDLHIIKNITNDPIKKRHRFNIRLIKKDGTTIWTEQNYSYITNEQNQIIANEGVISDITEQKLIEIALQESEEHFTKLFQFAPVLMVVADLKTLAIIKVNNLYLKTMGYKEEEILNIPGKIGFTIEKEKMETLKKVILAGGKLNGQEISLRTKNGNTVIGLVSSDSITIKGKTSVIFSIVDISDRIKAQKVAEENEKRFKLLAENIPMVTYLCKNDKHWSMLYLNENIKNLVGYQNVEFLNQSLKFSDLCHTDDLAEMYKTIDEAKKTKRTFKLQYRIQHKSGKWLWVEEFGIGFTTKDGEDLIVGSINNITERLKNEKELLKAKEKAEESDRLKSAFLANMSHEIRTPMNGILGFSDLLKEPQLSTEQQNQYIEIIEESGKRMLNIINDLIDISKIESGQMDVKITEVSLNHQLDYLHTFFKPEASKKNLEIISKINYETEIIFETDKEKFLAILINLIKNAIKYTNSGSIRFGYALKNKNLEFYIKDTGIGIPAEKHKSIFERFVQADLNLNKPYEGAGLGLAITKAYVNMLGGKIRLTSELGKGTTFYFTIPYKKPKTKNIDESIKTIEVEQIPKKISILIVDDDETSLMYLSEILKGFESELITAKSGNEALSICKSNKKIDLILMDIKMPILDGYEATKQIRTFNTEVKIIAQTAYALPGDKEKALEAGCNEYISKPVQKTELLEKINICLK